MKRVSWFKPWLGDGFTVRRPGKAFFVAWSPSHFVSRFLLQWIGTHIR